MRNRNSTDFACNNIVTQNSMGRSILKIKRKDKVRCTDIGKSTNALKHCKKQKRTVILNVTPSKETGKA